MTRYLPVLGIIVFLLGTTWLLGGCVIGQAERHAAWGEQPHWERR